MLIPGVTASQSVPVVAGFTPASLSGLQFWYDATDSTPTFSSGNNLTQLTDLSGNSNHMVNDDVEEATLESNIFGSRNGIDCSSGLLYTSGVSLSTAGTMVIVMVSDTFNENDFPIGTEVGENPGGVISTVNGGGFAMILANGSVENTSVTTAYSLNTPFIAIGEWDASGLYIYCNGSENSNGHSLGDVATAIPLYIGYMSAGYLGFACLYNRALDSGERDELITYLTGLYIP